jgi:hypothetical protein
MFLGVPLQHGEGIADKWNFWAFEKTGSGVTGRRYCNEQLMELKLK